MGKILKVSALVLLISVLVLTSIPYVFAQKGKERVLYYNSPMEYYKQTGKRITKFKEAPMLQELVKQGKLPPVEKRLPEEPLVVVPTKEVGKYGGILRGSSLNPQTWNDVEDAMVDGLFRFSNDLKEILPNLAKGYVFSDKFRKCT
ncbi:ABC transporter substrate-binding protein, partial [bacterium]|nr:ABC transporter substrate-binding protein [bacterium]